MQKIQVPQSHYKFEKYVHKKRWISLWYQLKEVLALQPVTLLELGPGPGLFKVLAGYQGIRVETVDLDAALKPDFVASATRLPLKDDAYDCVCAFQMLEHLPYDESIKAFGEMVRVATKNIVISLPDARKIWTYQFYIPWLGEKIIHFPRPMFKKKPHNFSRQHYWEINRKGYPLQKIISDFSGKNVKLMDTYRLKEYPYHRFCIYSKQFPSREEKNT